MSLCGQYYLYNNNPQTKYQQNGRIYIYMRERERESNPKNSTFSSLAIHVCHAHTSDSILYFFVYIFIFSLLSAYTTTTIPYHTIPYHSQPPPHAQHNHHCTKPNNHFHKNPKTSCNQPISTRQPPLPCMHLLT